MKNRGNWEPRPLTANNIFQCHVRIHFVTDSIWERDLLGTSWELSSAQEQAGSPVPHFSVAALQVKPSITCAQQAQILGSGVLPMSVCPCLPRYPRGKQPSGVAVSGDTRSCRKMILWGRTLTHGLLHTSTGFKGGSGAESPGQGTPAELPRGMVQVQQLPAKPHSESPNFGTWLCPGPGLHRVCPGRVKPLGSLILSPWRDTNTPWVRHTRGQHSSAQGAALMQGLLWTWAAFHQAWHKKQSQL